MKDEIGRRFVSVKTAAAYISVHEETLRSWIAENPPRIPAVRIGRCVRVDLKTLDAMLDAQLDGKAGDRSRR